MFHSPYLFLRNVVPHHHVEYSKQFISGNFVISIQIIHLECNCNTQPITDALNNRIIGYCNTRTAQGNFHLKHKHNKQILFLSKPNQKSRTLTLNPGSAFQYVHSSNGLLTGRTCHLDSSKTASCIHSRSFQYNLRVALCHFSFST